MKKKNAYLNTILVLVVITALAVDISVPILPVITDHFGADTSSSQLIISTFLAGYGIGMIPLGLLSDRYGRIPIIYLGLILYTIFGFLISLAWDFELILWGRFFQGIGGGVGPVLARAVARDVASGKELTKLMSVFVTALAFTTLCSPLLGSLLYDFFNWQVTFLVPPLLGLFLLFRMWTTSYETLEKKDNELNIWNQLKTSIQTYCKSKISVWALFITIAGFAGFQIILASSSLLMVDIYGMEASQVGWIFSISVIFYLLAAYFNKKKANTLSPIKLLGFGVVLFAIAIVGLLICYKFAPVPFWVIWVFISFYIAGIGMHLPNTSTIAMNPLPQIAGFASSFLGAVMILGAAVATVLASKVYDGTVFSISSGIIISGISTIILYAIGLYIFRKDVV